MDKERIEIEANIALHQLHSQVDEAADVPTILLIMASVCDELDKGENGAQAVRALLDLWQRLKLGDVSGDSISVFSEVVNQMYIQSTSQK